MINNKGRKGKRDPERAIMYYYSIHYYTDYSNHKNKMINEN